MYLISYYLVLSHPICARDGLSRGAAGDERDLEGLAGLARGQLPAELSTQCAARSQQKLRPVPPGGRARRAATLRQPRQPRHDRHDRPGRARRPRRRHLHQWNALQSGRVRSLFYSLSHSIEFCIYVNLLRLTNIFIASAVAPEILLLLELAATSRTPLEPP